MEKLCMDEFILSYVTLQGVDYSTFEVGEGSGGDFEKYILQGYFHRQKKKKKTFMHIRKAQTKRVTATYYTENRSFKLKCITKKSVPNPP